MPASQLKTQSRAEHLHWVLPGKRHQSHLVEFSRGTLPNHPLNFATSRTQRDPTHGSSVVQIQPLKITIRGASIQIIQVCLDRLTQQINRLRKGKGQSVRILSAH